MQKFLLQLFTLILFFIFITFNFVKAHEGYHELIVDPMHFEIAEAYDGMNKSFKIKFDNRYNHPFKFSFKLYSINQSGEEILESGNDKELALSTQMVNLKF